MRTTARLLFGFIACIPPAAVAGEVYYLGPGVRPDTARLRTSGTEVREMRKGEALPDLGELVDVNDEEAIFERTLEDDEREQLRASGAAVPDIQRFRLRRPPDGLR